MAEEREYEFSEIIGLTVVGIDGIEIGRVSAIMKTGANDVYVVTRADGSDALIPAIKQVIKKIDIDRRIITIEPLEGLL